MSLLLTQLLTFEPRWRCFYTFFTASTSLFFEIVLLIHDLFLPLQRHRAKFDAKDALAYYFALD